LYNCFMSEVFVDVDKLANGLEKGIAHTNTFFCELPTHQRLRLTPCGLISTAIQQYLVAEGVDCALKISQPNLTLYPDLQHVFPVINPDSQDPTVIDASYSQFFEFVGLHTAYEVFSGTDAFPPEKVISFRFSEAELAADWLTLVAMRFRHINKHPKNSNGYDVTYCQPQNVTRQQLNQSYATIWNPDNTEPWSPDGDTTKQAKIIAQHIPTGCVTANI